MASGFGSSQEDLISEINVTPLVDVVLVLLVIFMMTAPALYTQSLTIELPQAKAGEASPEQPISFEMDSQGLLMMNQKPITWEEIPIRLKEWGDAVREKSVLLSADQKTPHGKVIELLDLLKQAGIHKIGMSVQARP